MARQAGENTIEGCFGNIVFYKLGENFYARKKSSLDRKRVKRDPAFKETMRWAELLGKASKISSLIYKTIPEEKRERNTYKELTGKVMYLLKENKTCEEIILLLSITKKNYDIVAAKKNDAILRLLYADDILQKIFSCECEEEEYFLMPAPA